MNHPPDDALTNTPSPQHQYPTPASSADVIRISRDEALGSRVDDLLNRQKSMRGEAATRDKKRRFFYQNWFVFMIAGFLGALGGWAICEPFFEDMPYQQGAIEDMDLGDAFPFMDNRGQPFPVEGWITIKGQQIWLYKDSREESQGKWIKLNRSKLQVNKVIGIYSEYAPGAQAGQGFGIGRFVVFDPPPQDPAAASLTLQDLERRNTVFGLAIFAIVGGMIGLALGAADGLMCRLARRALLGGLIGLLVGFIGGFISSFIANLVYAPISMFAQQQSGNDIGQMSVMGFILQMFGRGLAWMFAGMTMGLGQGIALRSRRLFIYGFLGGLVGGLLGGLLFDPIDFIVLGIDKPSSHWSRLIGICCIGATVGLLIGVVELLARDAWLRMTRGPLSGKEFLVFKDTMLVGSSPRSDIFLFNDPLVEPHHATLRMLGEDCELENIARDEPVRVNDDRVATRVRLRHGDRIALGDTEFIFQTRKG